MCCRLLMGIVPAVAPVSASARLTWSTPALVDATPPLADDTFTPSGLACPSAGVCVAVDGRGGSAITWSNPGRGRPQWSAVPVNASCPSENPAGGAAAWATAPVDPGRGLTSVACPSVELCPAVTLCVAVDTNRGLAGSTDPAGGVGAWTVAPLSRAVAMTNPFSSVSVACPSTALCAAVDGIGDTWSSSDPSGGATT